MGGCSISIFFGGTPLALYSLTKLTSGFMMWKPMALKTMSSRMEYASWLGWSSTTGGLYSTCSLRSTHRIYPRGSSVSGFFASSLFRRLQTSLSPLPCSGSSYISVDFFCSLSVYLIKSSSAFTWITGGYRDKLLAEELYIKIATCTKNCTQYSYSR